MGVGGGAIILAAIASISLFAVLLVMLLAKFNNHKASSARRNLEEAMSQRAPVHRPTLSRNPTGASELPSYTASIPSTVLQTVVVRPPPVHWRTSSTLPPPYEVSTDVGASSPPNTCEVVQSPRRELRSWMSDTAPVGHV
ncbi:hypothetical protein CALCODRAFT_359783 [Calocera cornea HHB12733]|uniref:Uncharacterized protein n=1 Tax=Calocera cornea HHB12733 TaxID=1353952 RepID=A0A165EMD5_9BASI|nr:hypothetical protein CALCODRAFT_359783 [Calocera cornea HHB12733]